MSAAACDVSISGIIASRNPPARVNTYGKPVDIRKRLERNQKEVEARVPGATRTISDNMPAFKNERILFYFAACKKHIGIYPPVTKDMARIAETQAFRGPKSNHSFPHDQALPLIGRIAVSLSAQYKSE